MDTLISIKDLVFSRDERVIYKGINLDFARGKITAIMGPSGTGKTTLLHLISGMLTPDAGVIQVDGVDIASLDRKALYALRRRIGVLFQSGALFSHLSVYENVAFPLRHHTQLAESTIRDIVLMKLQAVGLRGARDLMPAALSGGMVRRVALARAIALEPEIILYDEPFAGQDPIAMGVVLTLIKSLNEALGLTSIIVSHDVQETARIADFIYLLAHGEVLSHGEPAALLADPSSHVQQFVQGLADGPVHFHYDAADFSADLGL